MTDLAAWLLEQIALDAKAFQFARDHDGGDGHLNSAEIASSGGGFVELHCSRMLAECEAKRQIIILHGKDPKGIGGECSACFYDDLGVHGLERAAYPCDTLKTLALPYSDRPGYRDEWKP